MTTEPTTPEDQAGGRRGRFHYLRPSTPSSLYRNGKVFMQRDPNGDDAGVSGLEHETHETTVFDARTDSRSPAGGLDRQGFELRNHPLEDPGLDFLDLEQLAHRYYPHCEQIVQDATGGRAFAFDHNVRSVLGKKSGKRISGGQPVQQPLHMVHGDYTLTSGPQRLRDLGQPPSRNDTLRQILRANTSLLAPDLVEDAFAENGRFAIINVWRNIAPEPVASHPLALCDSRTVRPEDLVVLEIHYEDRIGENYLAKHDPRHRWSYYPAMTRDEALLLKQWDSAGGLARSEGTQSDGEDPSRPSTFSFHSAFADPASPPDAPDRNSIEVRCVVLY